MTARDDYSNIRPWVQAAIHNGADVPAEHAAVLLDRIRDLEAQTAGPQLTRGLRALADRWERGAWDRHREGRGLDEAWLSAAGQLRAVLNGKG